MEIFGKKIDGTVLLIIALIFVALGFAVFTFVNNMIQKGSQQAMAQQAFLDGAQLEVYNNKMHTGDSVINCIRNLSSGDPQKIKVIVATNRTATPTYSLAYYGWVTTGRGDTYSASYAAAATARFFSGIATPTVTQGNIDDTTSAGSSAKETGTLVFKNYASLTVNGNDITDPVSPFFINPANTFLATYVKDTNDVVHTIKFVQQP